MNDLGIALAWLAVQVTLVLVPALALHAFASRRGPAAGAWVAALSLGLIAALCVVELTARPGRQIEAPTKTTASTIPSRTAATSPEPPLGAAGLDRPSPTAGLGWEFSGLRLAWDRIERGAAEPAARVRPWGGVVALVALGGMAFGLVRLLTGLWAVGVYRRRGRIINDPAMNELLDALRIEMGCVRTVELRETAELTTAATAGWRRPVLLLPDDWRSWTSDERRAVLAHELAHVVRGDYAAGLVARVALVLNSYHPLVYWLAGRLQLQQEQAADALGARFAGGRAAYLTALARMALKQDGRSPRWPAREFLADRGTLIRRIAMLRDQSETGNFDRPSSKTWRLLASVTLLGMTVGVAMLHGPANAADEKASTVETAKPAAQSANAPIVPPYVPDGVAGLVAFRPAAVCRRSGMGEGFRFILSEVIGGDLSQLSKKFKVDMSRPGFLKLGFEDVEWATCGIRFGRARNAERDNLHSIAFVGLTVHTFAPFDWPGFLRQWGIELAEVHEGGRIYYQIKGPIQPMIGPHPCAYLLDDRTIVLDEEAGIRSLISRKTPLQPAYVRTPEWNRASRGLLAVAMDNQNATFTKQYDLGRPDDAIVLSLFKGVEYWTLGVEDADSIAMHLAAACKSQDASEAIALALDPLLKLARDAVDQADPTVTSGQVEKLTHRMLKRLLSNLRVQHTDRSVDLQAEGFGTIADYIAIIEAEVAEGRSHEQAAAAKSKSTTR